MYKYRVMWWNTKGDACISEKMDKEDAMNFLSSLWEEQEGRIVCVKERSD